MNGTTIMTFQRFVDVLTCAKPILTKVMTDRTEKLTAITKHCIRFQRVPLPVSLCFITIFQFSEITLLLQTPSGGQRR
jgi:hypothetical protein